MRDFAPHETEMLVTEFLERCGLAPKEKADNGDNTARDGQESNASPRYLYFSQVLPPHHPLRRNDLSFLSSFALTPNGRTAAVFQSDGADIRDDDHEGALTSDHRLSVILVRFPALLASITLTSQLTAAYVYLCS